MVKKPDELIDVFMKHHDDFEINFESPFGDGHSAEKIMKILLDEIK